jgi:hypothetical protein
VGRGNEKGKDGNCGIKIPPMILSSWFRNWVLVKDGWIGVIFHDHNPSSRPSPLTNQWQWIGSNDIVYT